MSPVMIRAIASTWPVVVFTLCGAQDGVSAPIVAGAEGHERAAALVQAQGPSKPKSKPRRRAARQPATPNGGPAPPPSGGPSFDAKDLGVRLRHSIVDPRVEGMLRWREAQAH